MKFVPTHAARRGAAACDRAASTEKEISHHPWMTWRGGANYVTDRPVGSVEPRSFLSRAFTRLSARRARGLARGEVFNKRNATQPRYPPASRPKTESSGRKREEGKEAAARRRRRGAPTSRKNFWFTRVKESGDSLDSLFSTCAFRRDDDSRKNGTTSIKGRTNIVRIFFLFLLFFLFF